MDLGVYTYRVFSPTSLIYAWWPSWRTTVNCRMVLWVFRSTFFHSLENESRKQYLEKMKSVCDIGPCSLKKYELLSDFDTFPSICYLDIVDCLLFAPNSFTKEELKRIRVWNPTTTSFVAGLEMLLYTRH